MTFQANILNFLRISKNHLIASKLASYYCICGLGIKIQKTFVCVCVCVCVFYKNKKQWVETMECGCLWVKRLRQWGRGGCYILPFNNNQIHKACVYVFIPSQDESCFSLFCPLKNSDFFHWICFAICWIHLRKKIKKCDFKAKFVQLLWNLKKSEYRVDNLIDQYF